MSLFMEAILLGSCDVEQIITGVAGLAKVSDLVSDLNFIKAISEFNGIFENAQDQARCTDHEIDPVPGAREVDYGHCRFLYHRGSIVRGAKYVLFPQEISKRNAQEVSRERKEEGK
jgi:hypothetical protein